MCAGDCGFALDPVLVGQGLDRHHGCEIPL
jgi:hypothetical protein